MTEEILTRDALNPKKSLREMGLVTQKDLEKLTIMLYVSEHDPMIKAALNRLMEVALHDGDEI